jgi:hypothetical protein
MEGNRPSDRRSSKMDILMLDEYTTTMIRETHDTVIKLEERMCQHMNNQAIHHDPPCPAAQMLERRVWFLGGMVAAAMAVIEVIKAKIL